MPDEQTCSACGRLFSRTDPGAMTVFGMSVCPDCVLADDRATQERRALRGDPYDPLRYGPAPIPSMSREEVAQLQRQEAMAEAFRTRYGVDPAGAWTDQQIEQALADHGYPVLAALPGEPRGMMRSHADKLTGFTPTEARAWRRTNALHLVAHAILGHAGGRCGGCEGWSDTP